MTTSSALVASAPTSSDIVPAGTHGVAPKTTLTDNEVETLTKAYTMIFGVVRTMGADGTHIDANFLTSADTLGVLLGCAHRVSKSVLAANAKKERETYIAALDTYISSKVANKVKAIAAYNNLPAEVKSEIAAPDAVCRIWCEEFLPVFGAKYDIARAARTMHTLGYMVHIEKVDGRSKGKSVQPPYISVTVGQPFRTAVALAAK